MKISSYDYLRLYLGIKNDLNIIWIIGYLIFLCLFVMVLEISLIPGTLILLMFALLFWININHNKKLKNLLDREEKQDGKRKR